jgi:Flp pilus assembly protein TadD
MCCPVQIGKALDMLQQCMQHTPTLVELYTLKAKILKHAGDVEGAAAAADKARSMDLADRCCCTSVACMLTFSCLSHCGV